MKQPRKSKKQSLTLIIPVFNEQFALPKFLNELRPIIAKFQGNINCQLLFVNNGSNDSSVQILRKELQNWVPAGILTLSRNFGYETALIAGLTFADSDFYGFCDADGEDPVEIIPKFLDSMRNGFFIALGIRRGRVEAFSTRSFRAISYKLLAKVSDDPFRINGGNFSMFNQVVKNAIIVENSSFPFLRATLSRSGYPLEEFIHNRKPRLDGKSKYRKINLLKFALAGFLTTTTWPLRFIAYISILNVLAITIFTIFNYGMECFYPIILNEFFLFFSTIGIYLARIYKNSLGRPLFYINWIESFSFNNHKWPSKVNK